MVPRATRNPTPLTATKPANSFVRSSVSRIASAPTDNDVPSPRYRCTIRGLPEGPRPGPHGACTGTIAAQPSQYDVGRTVAGHCRGPDGRRGGGSLRGKKGTRPAVGEPAGRACGSTRWGVGGTRADLSSGPAI